MDRERNRQTEEQTDERITIIHGQYYDKEIQMDIIIDRQRDRQTHRGQTDRQKNIYTDKWTLIMIKKGRWIDRQRDNRQIEGQTYRKYNTDKWTDGP